MICTKCGGPVKVIACEGCDLEDYCEDCTIDHWCPVCGLTDGAKPSAYALGDALQRELQQRIAELEAALRAASAELHTVQWVDVETLYHHGGGYRCAACLEHRADDHAPKCRTKAALDRAQKVLEGGK